MAADAVAPSVMRLSPRDNIAVALRPLKAGESVTLDGVALIVERNTAVGGKLAAQPIAAGDVILKYSCPIGTATRAIPPGSHVDTHNVESNYLPTCASPTPAPHGDGEGARAADPKLASLLLIAAVCSLIDEFAKGP
jgi:SAF domain